MTEQNVNRREAETEPAKIKKDPPVRTERHKE